MISQLYVRKTLTPEQESNLCLKCQWCCRNLMFFNAMPKPLYEQFIGTWGIQRIFSNINNSITYIIPWPCQHISHKNGCTIYDSRPTICRQFRGGDTEPDIRPFCLWYEPVNDDEKINISRVFEFKMDCDNTDNIDRNSVDNHNTDNPNSIKPRIKL